MQRLDVRDTVAEVLLELEPRLAAKGLDSVADIPGELYMSADPARVRTILLELLTNAIAFTDRGGYVMVDVGFPDGMPDGVVMLRVADGGRGIPREKQEHIFDPFMQPDVPAGGGISHGLATARELARGMGGDLRVRSDEGKGSVFTLTVPGG